MERLTHWVGHGFVVLISLAMMTSIVACGAGAVSNGGQAASNPNAAVSSYSWSGRGDGSDGPALLISLTGGDYRLTFHGHVATCQYDVRFYAWDNSTFDHFILQNGSVNDPASGMVISTAKLNIIGANTVLDLEPHLSATGYALQVGASGSSDSPCPWDASIGG